ncbi:hypothetical protein [Streptomyces somaliensis]|uniref:hypothetical protein n=1 Tax=Streptomyces somaliensis TaxID=78355 RepID=UPI003F74CA25|nr:recombinase family protein [Streptomyces somaliensis]
MEQSISRVSIWARVVDRQPHKTRGGPPMEKREELVSRLRGVPEGTPSVDEVRAMLAADPTLKCVVCYARISFDGRVKDAHGIEDQHREMGENARAFNWLVVYRYTDNDKSASKESVVRDDFEQLITDLKAATHPRATPSMA